MGSNHNFKVFSIALFLFCLSCNSNGVDLIDRDANLTRNEAKYALIKDRRGKKKPETLELTKKETIPEISKLIVSPPPPPIGSGKLISFSVTEEIPLKDVIIELGRIADIDIEVDPAISGGIILKVKEKSLETIIERICELGNLRYSYTDGILRFENDTAYSVDYTVDFLINDDLWNSIQTSIQSILVNAGDKEAKTNINKPASMITVYANSKSQKKVADYIQKAKRNYSAQVLIEAKIVEVKLDDEFNAGIDWSFLNTSSTQDSLTITNTTTPEKGLISGVLNNKVFGGTLTNTIRALQTFGTTKTISSPRIHAINNQEAKLEFVNTLIYFTVERDTEQVTGTTAVSTVSETSTKEEETEGVMLTITPSINLKTQEITLRAVPELKVKVGDQVDPIEADNKIPIIQSRKMTTSVKLKSGGVMVIGGLMKESTENTDTGVPGLSKIPFLGYLFKAKAKDAEITETVIFLKATIVDSDGGVDKYDRDFYEKYSSEKRPLFN